MSWNYRVLKAPCKWNIGGEDYTDYYYRIYEVYYKADGTIEAWSSEPCQPFGESKDELNSDLNIFIRATVLPILEEVNGTLVEVKE